MNNPLWEYSNRQYAREGVAQTCLSLQDDYGVDVNMLFYAAWLATEGRRVDRAHMEALSHDVGQWRDRVVRPLRTLRRQWKTYAPVSRLREQLKNLELEAERVQQDRMLAFYRRHPPPCCDSADILTNLGIVAEFACPDVGEWKPFVALLSRLLDG